MTTTPKLLGFCVRWRLNGYTNNKIYTTVPRAIAATVNYLRDLSKNERNGHFFKHYDIVPIYA